MFNIKALSLLFWCEIYDQGLRFLFTHHTLTQTLTWLAKNVNVSLGGDHLILRGGGGSGKFGQDGKFIFRYINARIFIFIRKKKLKKSTDRPENTNVVEDVEILLPVNFRWIPFSGFRCKNEIVSANERPGRPFSYFLIGPKKQKIGRDVDILLPVKFRWIPFNSLRGEVENVSANQRPGRPSCFFQSTRKHKLGRGHWDLASCQVSLNSVQRFQRRSQKCRSQSETRATILFFRSANKLHKRGRGRWYLASCQLSLNSIRRFQGSSRKFLSQSEARAAILFFLTLKFDLLLKNFNLGC